MKKLYGILLAALLLGGMFAAVAFALVDVGIPSATVSLERFSPSSGMEMKELTRESLESLDTTADSIIAYLGNVVVVNDGSRLHSVWSGSTNSLYIVSPDGAYTNLLMTTSP